MSARCAAPGCDRPISDASRTGVCRDHMHAAGACRCAQCRGERRRYRVLTRDEARDAGLVIDTWEPRG